MKFSRSYGGTNENPHDTVVALMKIHMTLRLQ